MGWAEERAAFDHARWQAGIAGQCRRSDAEAEAVSREKEAEAADKDDAASVAAWMRVMRGEPVPTLADRLEAARMAEDGPARNPAAPWGSPENPAMILDGVVLEPGPPRATRSQADKDLDRGRQLASDLQRYRRQRSGRQREVIRSLGPADEIDCHGCREVGASREQSWLLHQDPDADPRLAWEMDPPPAEEPSYRADSGTGWPRQTPMIYR